VEEKGFLFMPEFRMKRKNGTLFPSEHSVVPLENEQGKRIGWVSVVRDISESKQVEQALREGEERFSKAFRSIPDALVISRLEDGKIVEVNDSWYKVFGYSREETIGKTSFALDLFAGTDDRKHAITMLREQGSLRDFELQIRQKSGALLSAILSGELLEIRGEQYLLSVIQDVTERKRAEAELAKSHEQLRALTIYWQTAIEEERAHIAREMHDEFGQSMTALKMDLTWLARRLPEGDEKVERIRGMDSLVDDSIALIRRIATDLRPALLDDLGLNAALEWQAQEFSKCSGITCRLSLPKDDLDIDPALSMVLFRLFQETLTNINRHAQATRVNASLKKKEQALVLTMRDNGRGITQAELINPRSLGLLSLRERAAQWGGSTTIHGVAGKGTTVTVRIPLPATPVIGGKR